jgi:hypothetical protein
MTIITWTAKNLHEIKADPIFIHHYKKSKLYCIPWLRTTVFGGSERRIKYGKTFSLLYYNLNILMISVCGCLNWPYSKS